MRPVAAWIPAMLLALVEPGGERLLAQTPFIRGDADGSDNLSVTDAVRTLRHLFEGEPEGVACEDAADADDDGALGVTDAVYLLTFLFAAGEPPPFPFPFCGGDPTADDLGCATFAGCRPAFTFFGEPFAADGAAFVVDRSGTMLDFGELARAKEEVLRAIEGFSEDVHFMVVFFDTGILIYPPEGLAPATAEEKLAVRDYVERVLGGIGSCPLEGLRRGFDRLLEAPVSRRAMFYVGDGGGTCHGRSERDYLSDMVDAITAENAGRAQINAIGVLMGNRWQEQFVQELASRNGGRYLRIE